MRAGPRSRWVDKAGYLDHATVQRREGVVDEAGPGTALMECDQAMHRVIGVAASLTTTWLAVGFLPIEPEAAE